MAAKAKRATKRHKEANPQETTNPIEAVERLTDSEALSFRALDAELRNHLQGIRIIDYEIESLKRKIQDEITVKLNQKKQLEAAFSAKKAEYDQLVKDLAERRGLDPTKLVIDPDAKTVRDLRNEAS